MTKSRCVCGRNRSQAFESVAHASKWKMVAKRGTVGTFGLLRYKNVNSHRDRGGPGRETQNCRHFWTCLWSSRLESVNSHKDGRETWSRNAELSSLLDLYLVLASQKCQQSQGSGGLGRATKHCRPLFALASGERRGEKRERRGERRERRERREERGKKREERGEERGEKIEERGWDRRGEERGGKRERRGERREERREERKGDERRERRGEMREKEERGEMRDERGGRRERRDERERRGDDPGPMSRVECCYLCDVLVTCLHLGSWIP